jgi:hypothetical protein
MRTTLAHSIRSAACAMPLAFSALQRAGAQLVDSSCVYDRAYNRCALNIVPRLFALDVVRGAREERVASLAFLLPKRVVPAFAGSEPAEQHAASAFRLRRTAAVLTDLGSSSSCLQAAGLPQPLAAGASPRQSRESVSRSSRAPFRFTSPPMVS